MAASENSVRLSFLLVSHDQEFVTLVSSDGHEFIISRKCAMEAGTIKSMLSGPGTLPLQLQVISNFSGMFIENGSNEITFREIS